jgi:hypothetical protein
VGALKEGDRVRWSAGRAELSGVVEQVLTRPTRIGERTVKASEADPRFVVRADGRPTSTVRRAASLTPIQKARRFRPALGRRIVFATIGLIVLLGAAGAYFLYLPGRLAASYEDDAKPAFTRIDDSMFQIYEALHSRYFRGLAVKEVNDERARQDTAALRREARRQYAADHHDIQAARLALAHATAAIARNRGALTSVDHPPLLGGIGDVSDAKDTADRASAYLDQATRYLDEFKSLVGYASETLQVDQFLTNAFLDNIPGDGATLTEFEDATDRILKGALSARSKLKELGGPPTGARPFDFTEARSIETFVTFLRGLHSGFAQLDIGQIDAANGRLKRDLRTLSVRSLLQFDRLQTHSQLSRTIDELETKEDGLAHRLGTRPSTHSIAPPTLDFGPPPGSKS